MQGNIKLSLVLLLLVFVWIITYWLTPAPGLDAATRLREEMSAQSSAEPAAVILTPPARVDSESAGPSLLTPSPGPSVLAPPSSSTSTPPAARPVGPEPNKAAGGGGVVAPAFNYYTVLAGDTATKISQRVFGTDKYWRQVLKSNPTIDFTRLRAGTRIKVPRDPSNIQGVPEKASDEQARNVEYTVNDHDTLSSIAAMLYGRSALWPMIRDANRELVGEDGTRLRAGMTLQIPPPPAGVEMKSPPTPQG